MNADIPGKERYTVKLAVSLVAVLLLLFVSSPLTLFYFPAISKQCLLIDIMILILWLLVFTAMGEVFADKRGDRTERILISDENTAMLLFNVVVFAVLILLVIAAVMEESESRYFDLFLQAGHAIYFSIILYIAYLILRPTSIELEGNTVIIRPSISVRYSASGKMAMPSPSIHFFLRPIVSLLTKSPGKKVIELPRDAMLTVPLARNSAGNKRPILMILGRTSEEIKLYIVLEKDISLDLLVHALGEYLNIPDKA